MSANQQERPKISVGTVSTKISYDRATAVFKPTDVPEPARRAKEQVKQMLAKKKDKLGVKRSEWSTSVELLPDRRPPCERKTRQLSKHELPLLGQTYNFRAEVLPQKPPRYFPSASKHEVSTASFMGASSARPATATGTSSANSTTSDLSGWSYGGGTVRPSTSLARTSVAEMSVNPKLDGAQPWDTTTTLAKTLQREDLARLETAAQRNTLKHTRRLKAPKRGEGGTYMSPEARYRLALNERRAILDSPNGAVYLSKVRDGTLNPPPPHRPKLQLATGTKPRLVTVYQHSGKWEMNKATGKMHWSDTGSEDYESRGDIVKTVNLDAYCFGVDADTEY